MNGLFCIVFTEEKTVLSITIRNSFNYNMGRKATLLQLINERRESMKRSFSSGIASFLSAVLFMNSGFGNGMIYALEEETNQQPAADPEWFLADLCDAQTV